MEIFKSTFAQLISSNINRILGIFIVALMYRIFDVKDIGEYFFLISIFSIFVTIREFGSGKVIIKLFMKEDQGYAEIFRTRAVLSIFLVIIFYLITKTLSIKIAEFDILLIILALCISTLTLNFVLEAKQKYYSLSLIQLLSQLVLFFIFLFAYLQNINIPISFHQFIPSLILFIGISSIIRNGKFIKVKNFLIIKNNFLISNEYFFKHRVLIFIQLVLASIMFIDYVIAKYLLNLYDLGIFTGILRLGIATFGILLVVNKVMYTYAIDDLNLFIKNKKNLLAIVSLITNIGLIFLIYPYLKYVMNLADPSLYFLPSFFILLGSFLIPKFFDYINYIEVNSDIFNLRELCISFLKIIFIMIFIIISVTKMVVSVNMITIVSIIYFIKWLLVIYFLREITNANKPQ